jgi:hypothetical protein
MLKEATFVVFIRQKTLALILGAGITVTKR